MTKNATSTKIARPIPRITHRVNDHGQVIYKLKHAFRDGTTHLVFDPLAFLARLAALVPRPRANVTRYHGVFAPNFKHRKLCWFACGCSRMSSSLSTLRGANHCNASDANASAIRSASYPRIFSSTSTLCSPNSGPARVIEAGVRDNLKRLFSTTNSPRDA